MTAAKPQSEASAAERIAASYLAAAGGDA